MLQSELRRVFQRMMVRLGLSGRAETMARCGIELSEPEDGKKGVFLLYSTRLPEFELVWRHMRRRYAIVLMSNWELLDHILRDYRRNRHRIDCVLSPAREYDQVLGFAPIFRSNSADLLVDDELWPRLHLKRDIEVAESVSVLWLLKRPLRWLDEVQRYLDRRGTGRAVYALKREPGPKEDAECHRQYAAFRARIASDPRLELRLGIGQREMAEIYNRARAIYHPSNSEFGCRAALEAMYCGAWPIVEPFDWVWTISADANIRQLVQVQQGLERIPDGDLPEIRQWQTARGLRSRLLEFLARDHRVNTRIKAFTLYSHVHIDSASGKATG